MKHPQKFLKKFNEQMSQLPVNQDIPNVPTIDWDKYKIPSVSHVVQKPETRYKGKNCQDKNPGFFRIGI